MAGPFGSPFASGGSSPFGSPFGGTSAGTGLSGMPPAQLAAYLRQLAAANLAQPPDQGGGGIMGALHLDVLTRAASQIANSFIYTIPGLYEQTKAGVEDIGDLVTRGDISPERTGSIFQAIGKQMTEDVRHPLRNPGYLAMDVLTLASLGRGGAERIGGIGRGLRGDFPVPQEPPTGYRALPPATKPLVETRNTLEKGIQHASSLPELDTYQQSLRGHQAVAEAAGVADRVDFNKLQAQIDERRNILQRYQEGNWPTGKTAEPALPAEPSPTVESAPTAGAAEAQLQPPAPFKPAQPRDLFEVVNTNPLEMRTKEPLPSGSYLHVFGEGRTGARIEERFPTGEVGYSVKVDKMEGVTRPGMRAMDIATGLVNEFNRTGERPLVMAEHVPIPKKYQGVVEPTAKAEATSAQVEAHPKEPTVAPESPALKEQKTVSAQDVAQVEKKAPEPVIRETPTSAATPELPEGFSVSAATSGERVTGGTLRQLGISPRHLGLTARQAPDIPADVLQATQNAAISELRGIFKSTGKPPTEGQKWEAIRKAAADNGIPEDIAKELFSRGKKQRGGAPRTSRQVIGDVIRGFREARTTEQYLLKTEVRKTTQTLPTVEIDGHTFGGEEYAVERRIPVNVQLSRNPLVRSAQRLQFGLMQKYPQHRFGIFHGTLDKRVAFELKEIDRIVHGFEATPEASQLSKIAEEVKAHPFRAIFRPNAAVEWEAWVDSLNDVAKLGALYLKPAYLTANMIGQIMLSMSDHAWNPINVLKTVKLQRQIFSGLSDEEARALAQAIRQSMGEGLAQSLVTYERSLSPMLQGAVQGTASFYNRILDTPFRDNAFIHEAIQQGFDTPEKIKELVLNPGYEEQRISVARRANRNIIDYARLGDREKSFVRRVIFFYPWFKAATIYGGRFTTEHPAQALYATQIGHYGEKVEAQKLGPLPSFLQGVFAFGSREVPGLGKVPTVVNTQAVTVLGTPGQIIKTATQALTGERQQAYTIGQYLTPAASAAIAIATNRDPFTGKEYSSRDSNLHIMLDQLQQPIAINTLFKSLKTAGQISSGEVNPATAQILYPRNKQEAILRYILGVNPQALNVQEAHSRAASESRSLETKREAALSKRADWQTQYENAGQKAGLFSQAPSDLRQALGLRAGLEAEYVSLQQALGHELSPIERMQAELQLLVRRGIYDSESAKQLLLSYSSLPATQIDAFRRGLRESFFGGDTLSYYGSQLRGAGQPVSVP